jgi:hypothetical protein
LSFTMSLLLSWRERSNPWLRNIIAIIINNGDD